MLTKSFYDAIESKNITRIRIMMQDSLLIDPTFEEFNEMKETVSRHLNIYDKHDEKEFIENKNLWNDNYMDKVMVEILSNFSKERLEHLKKVVRYLRPVSNTINSKYKQDINTNYRSNTYKEEKRRCQERGDYRGTKKICGGAIIGATIGGVATSIASASVMVIIGSITAGAIIGGVATSVIINGGKN